MSITLNYLPIYDQIFRNSSDIQIDLNTFKSDEKHLIGPLSGKEVDFSIRNNRTWFETAKQVSLFGAKIIFFPWGIYCLTRYIFQRLIMMALYPAQSHLTKKFYWTTISTASLEEKRKSLCKTPKDNPILRHVVLEKDGVRYSGLLIANKSTILNGRWVLQASGRGEPIENSLSDANSYALKGFNTLSINGPAVGQSEGHATLYSMGEVQELGITFLEKAIQAKKIGLAGRSLGGIAIGEAILQHTFDKKIQYSVARQISFDSVSNIVKKMFPRWAFLSTRLVKWSGCESDSLKASLKLQEQGIQEIIIQATNKDKPLNGILSKDDFISDGVIPSHATLAYRLVKKNITAQKTFIYLNACNHRDKWRVATATAEAFSLALKA